MGAGGEIDGIINPDPVVQPGETVHIVIWKESSFQKTKGGGDDISPAVSSSSAALPAGVRYLYISPLVQKGPIG